MDFRLYIKHISHDEILDRSVIASFGYIEMFGLKETFLWPEEVLTDL